MASINKDIKALVDLWSQFEGQKESLAGRQVLKVVIDMALDILGDESRENIHPQVKQLMTVWFERLTNWYRLSRKESPDDHARQHVYAQNIQLFNEDDFDLKSGYFDNVAWIEAIYAMAKPEKTWTANDRKLIAWLDGKLELLIRADKG